MKRLANSVVLTVVVASSSSLFAACGNGVCKHSATHGDCHNSQPVYHNTEFPGTCRECKDEYAYSLWADYCNTKRRGPAYKLHRHKSCLHCGPRLGDSCGAQCSCGQHHGHANSAVASPQDNHPVQPYPATDTTNDVEPTEAGDADTLVPPSEPQAEPGQIEAESAAIAPNSPAPFPPEPRYFGQPRSKSVSTTDGNLAEFDEVTMPAELGVDGEDGFGSEDEIKQSVDEAVEKALEPGNEAPTPKEFDDRSAKKRPSLFRIFRPRSR